MYASRPVRGCTVTCVERPRHDAGAVISGGRPGYLRSALAGDHFDFAGLTSCGKPAVFASSPQPLKLRRTAIRASTVETGRTRRACG
jgi:hypothetical protein